jgi:hypothetical protein
MSKKAAITGKTKGVNEAQSKPDDLGQEQHKTDGLLKGRPTKLPLLIKL